MVFEDLTTFSELDPGDIYFSQTATRNTAILIKRNVKAYVYKDYGIGYFTDYQHLCDIRNTGGNGDGYNGHWYVATTIEDLNGVTDSHQIYLFDGVNRRIFLRDKASLNSDFLGALSRDTTYYLTITRIGTALTCDIYTDAARTALIPGGNLSVVCSNTAMRYLYVGGTAYTATKTDTYSGWTENVDLQEVGPPTGLGSKPGAKAGIGLAHGGRLGPVGGSSFGG